MHAHECSVVLELYTHEHSSIFMHTVRMHIACFPLIRPEVNAMKLIENVWVTDRNISGRDYM